MAMNFRANKLNIRGAVISIEALSENIQFCTANGAGDDVRVTSAKYNDRPFDTEFFDLLGKTVKDQMEKNPEMDIQKASLILPNRLFLTDMVSIPVIHRKAMQHSLSLAIESIYHNADKMNLMTYGVQQNKQTATYGIVGIRRDLLEQIRGAFANKGVTVTDVTFASNAMVNGAMALNAKLRGETFLILDIKKSYARLALVVRGCTMGYFDLPFGYSIMHRSRLVAEDKLFDHRSGELLVLNAKERARAKQLTVESFAPIVQDDDEDFFKPDDSDPHNNKRRLPKFMQRPVPQSEEEYIYDNFRVFIKWALDLITNNRQIVSLDKLSTVYINMPERFNFLFNIVNTKQEGRGLTFAPLLTNEYDDGLRENLELCGGFFMNRYNEANTF